MRTPPSRLYSGTTIIIDEPSRFDKDHNMLLAGPARRFLADDAGLDVETCDLRTIDETPPWLKDTTSVILAGNRASNKYLQTSNDPPGYIRLVPPGIRATTVFDIQDCCDFRNLSGDDAEAEENFTERDSKERIPTRRKNYRFWTAWHIRKLLSGATVNEPEIKPICYPKLNEVVQLLMDIKDEDLYLDIETSRTHQCLTVVGVSSTSIWPRIYVVPVYLISGQLAYSNFHSFHHALSRAMVRNTVVGHNIAGFDLLVLAMFYGFPLPTIKGGPPPYDTMLANHRAFPEAEKSLAHVIAQWTEQPYHKDLSTDVYNNEQQNALWIYNAHDVYTLKLIKDAQLAYAATIPGLSSSIAQANSSIVPYVANSLTGLPLDQMRLAEIGGALGKQKEALSRIASTLVGRPFNPGSSQQCAKFFHDELNYPPVGKTESGRPAMGRKALYQLYMKHNNPLLPVIIKYRSAAKDLGTLESELL